MRLSVPLLLLLVAPALADPSAALAAAVADARKLTPDARTRARYLYDPYYLIERKKVFDFWANSLSREVDLVKLVAVGAGVLRADLADYGWDAKVWEKLADADPYFHAQIETFKLSDTLLWPGGRWEDGKEYAAGSFTYQKQIKVRQTAAAPWVDARQIGELIAFTQSQAPLLRADWWLVQTAAQVGREGTGYYDFLGLKKRDDYFKLIGLDVKAAQRLKKEVAAIVARSGVALNNRQVFRLQSLSGGHWTTLDSLKDIDKNNAIRLLNGDYAHDAEEHYGFLPNGLFAFFLSNAAGVRQDSVPDGIAGDHVSTSNDRRIHPGVSCIRCHVEGIRSINDWGRRAYTGALQLQSVDYERLKRLRRLYLSDLDRHVKRDREDYAEALLSVNGLTPGLNAKAFAAVWQQHLDADVSLDDAAKELGTTAERFTAALKAYHRRTGQLDPVLAGYLADPPLPARREHLEEVFGQAALIVQGKQ